MACPVEELCRAKEARGAICPPAEQEEEIGEQHRAECPEAQEGTGERRPEVCRPAQPVPEVDLADVAHKFKKASKRLWRRQRRLRTLVMTCFR